ncbi:MAG TPA: hypothetical protein PKH78_00120 [Candidatus Obscuribacter sp.]|nr:hypothetical protein [Candidatus Obscuribacter sp.]HNN61407.1 hypothetical protein [Candidatus Obscuribacter sp.]
MSTYREILSNVIERTAPSFFQAQHMPRELMLADLVPKQAGVVLTKEECNRLGPIFQKLIDGAFLTPDEDAWLDTEK